MKEIPTKGGDEHDAFSRFKRVLHWRPGERKAIKRGFNKRARKLARLRVEREAQ